MVNNYYLFIVNNKKKGQSGYTALFFDLLSRSNLLNTLHTLGLRKSFVIIEE